MKRVILVNLEEDMYQKHLMPLIMEVEKEYNNIKNDSSFQKEFDYYLEKYVGRPSPLFFAERITNDLKGPKIYFKRDELNHTGAHKINNCIGQILLAKKMGKKRIIAETGAGQHGVATATVCALFDLPCINLYGRKRYKKTITKCIQNEIIRCQN